MDTETDNMTYSHVEPCPYKADLVSRRIGLFLLHLFMFIVGLIMNLIVVWVNWQRRRTRNTVIFCILNMGVADTMLMFILPISMLEIVLDYVWIWGDFLCRFTSLVTVGNIHASSFFLAYISVERYRSMVRGSAPNLMATSEKLKRNFVCAALWMFALLFGLLETVHVRVLGLEEPGCYLVPEHDYTSWFTSLVIIQFFVQFLIPSVIMVTFNTLTARAITSSPDIQIHTVSDVWFLHVYSSVFIICWLPFQLIMILILVDLSLPDVFDCIGVEQLFFSYAIVKTIALFHCLANPILYSFLSRSFRSKLINLILSHLPQDPVTKQENGHRDNQVHDIDNGDKANDTSQSEAEP